jgi:hypothetical protein
MRRYFSFMWLCAKHAFPGNAEHANNWQWVVAAPLWQSIGTGVGGAIGVALSHVWRGAPLIADNTWAGIFLGGLAGFVVTWVIAFLIRFANAPAALFYQRKERVDALESKETLEARFTQNRQIEAQEAHTAAIKEQSQLLKEQIEEARRLREQAERENSPLHRAIRDKQEQQIKAALDPELRKQAWINTLRKEYIASHDDVSPGLLAGSELPPAEWMNSRLAELNKPWRL